MKMKMLSLALCLLGLASSTLAQDGGTLAKIKQNKVMTLGVRESAVPFSYYDGDQKIVGYSKDLCDMVVVAVKEKLNMPDLVVKEIPVTPVNRIPLMVNGSIDIECGSTTHNLVREKQVAFSNTTFVISTRLLVKKSSGVKDFEDLVGKNVVTTAGTTPEEVLRRLNQERSLNMNIISAKDHAESWLTLKTDRASGFFIDDALMYGQLAKAEDANEYEIVGKPQTFESYALMLRKGDPEFKALVDETLAAAMKSGKVTELYNQWFMSAIPPNGINLNFPMSDAAKAAFENPNDKAFQ